LNANIDKIDVLINNAGVVGKRTYEESSDGVESHFAGNYLGHFLFANLIIEKVFAAKGVIINITSMAYTSAEISTDNVNFDVSSRSIVGTNEKTSLAHGLMLDLA